MNIQGFGVCLNDIDKFQDHYDNQFQIVVYALNPNSGDSYVLYSGDVQSHKKLFLVYQHLTSLKVLLIFKFWLA